MIADAIKFGLLLLVFLFILLSYDATITRKAIRLIRYNAKHITQFNSNIFAS